jgi:16S rRNA processing protein RimM
LGAIAGAHGVRGAVIVKPFTDDPEAIASYGQLSDETGQRTFKLTRTGKAKSGLVCKVEGVNDRDQAQALKGTRLYIERARLPETEEDEFYHADLIGLEAKDPNGTVLGRIKRVEDFGAGDLIELEVSDGETVFLPFTEEIFPIVNVAKGEIMAIPPDGALSNEPPEAEPRNEPDDEPGDQTGPEEAK